MSGGRKRLEKNYREKTEEKEVRTRVLYAN